MAPMPACSGGQRPAANAFVEPTPDHTHRLDQRAATLSNSLHGKRRSKPRLRRVQLSRSTDEGFEGALVQVISLVEVDRASHLALEAGVEEPSWIPQGGAFGEGELHLVLVGLAGEDDPVV